MNNLEKIKLINEMVTLRRKVMKLDEIGEMPMQPGQPGDAVNTCYTCNKPLKPGQPNCEFCGARTQTGGYQQPDNQGAGIPTGQRFKPQNPFSNQAGMQNLGSQIRESTACSSEGIGSRTGMDENAFAQDANVSTDRKRSAEGKSESLEEGLENYYKIAGL